MSDGVNIDWSLARPATDFAGAYANAFDLGRRMAAPPTPALAPAGPAALDSQLAGLDPPARAYAAQQAELLVSLGTGLKAYPYAQRGAILAHMAPALVARGVPAASIAAFDPSDPALDAAVAAARTLQTRLAAGAE